MFGLGYQELLLILVIVLVLFGGSKLPDLAPCFGFFDTPRHGIVFPQRAQMNAGIRFSAPGVLNTSSIARSISDSR